MGNIALALLWGVMLSYVDYTAFAVIHQTPRSFGVFAERVDYGKISLLHPTENEMEGHPLKNPKPIPQPLMKLL